MHDIKKKAKLGICEVCGRSVKLFVHSTCGGKTHAPHKARRYSAATINNLSGEGK